MNIKIYPKAIVLRKSVMVLTILFMGLMVTIIIYNLSHSSYKKEKRRHQTLDNVASSADTSWYENKTFEPKEGKFSEDQPSKVEIDSHNTSKNSLKFFSQESLKPTSMISFEETQKAMSAPITSNQLVAEPQAMTSNVTVNTNTNAIPSEIEQNAQGEKKSFLQIQNLDENYLESTLKGPVSPYEVQAGTIIPGILITGINSDLPGQLTAQVRSNVYDSIAGKYLLIPQGAKLIGLYDSQITYGQRRVLIVWNRIIFPNGQSINLNGMPGIDLRGYAGFSDEVNTHYGKLFSSVLMMSVLSAGAQLSQPQNGNNAFAAPSVGQTLAQSVGTNISNTASSVAAKNLNIQPTLEIRPGFLFNISITKDIVFPGAYSGDEE